MKEYRSMFVAEEPLSGFPNHAAARRYDNIYMCDSACSGHYKENVLNVYRMSCKLLILKFNYWITWRLEFIHLSIIQSVCQNHTVHVLHFKLDQSACVLAEAKSRNFVTMSLNHVNSSCSPTEPVKQLCILCLLVSSGCDDIKCMPVCGIAHACKAYGMYKRQINQSLFLQPVPGADAGGGLGGTCPP